MRNQLVWQDRFNIGVDFVDKEHKKLFSIMNRLFTFSEQAAKSQWVCEEGIKYFKEHASKHFAEEEAYMASIDYSGFETHRRLHDNFRQKTLPALERELMRSGYSPDSVNHFLGVCAGWLIGHTLTEDHAITGKTKSKWSGLLPEDKLSALKQIITDFLFDLFRLDTQLISEHYGGEKFGHGIYYRMVYASSKGEELEIILIFEEKLLLNTVGKMMGDTSENVNVMMVNATRYLSRQFINCIQGHFPSNDSYEIKAENLLTYEQLQKTFGKQQPQCSLLFDTGAGYFAFCIMAPRLLSSEPGSTIKTENAMSEIKKYLDRSKPGTNKKILVVDDSGVALQAMNELLSKDYQITLAQTGLSALQSIILDRPDLILLDYEMPICDGRQILEMIRSEKDMADIPVIFLTGKTDAEIVKKILTLKPAGYLSKALKPAEIKHNIDNFFLRKQSK